MPDENKTAKANETSTAANSCENLAWARSASRLLARLRSRINSSSRMYCTSPRLWSTRQARSLSARFSHARCELGHLHYSLAGRLFLVSGVHASRLPDCMEAGTGHHCVPVPRKQVQARRRKNRRPGAQAAAWKRIWLNDDGDLLVDRSTDVPPLQRDPS